MISTNKIDPRCNCTVNLTGNKVKYFNFDDIMLRVQRISLNKRHLESDRIQTSSEPSTTIQIANNREIRGTEINDDLCREKEKKSKTCLSKCCHMSDFTSDKSAAK